MPTVPNPRQFIARCALWTLWLISASCVAAGWTTFVVDDSMSQTLAPAAQLRWRSALPARNSADMLEATMQVHVVLNVSPWVGKPARIYMVMPPIAQSSLTVQWASSGLLLAGRLTGGQRQLVFQGVVCLLYTSPSPRD